MDYIKAFIVGGFICVLGQILIDKTKLSSARIQVLFVVIGCILGGLGIYKKIIDFGGAGATVPIFGFGYLLSEGVIKEVSEKGLMGIFTGGLKTTAGGITAALFFSSIASLIAEPQEK